MQLSMLRSLLSRGVNDRVVAAALASLICNTLLIISLFFVVPGGRRVMTVQRVSRGRSAPVVMQTMVRKPAQNKQSTAQQKRQSEQTQQQTARTQSSSTSQQRQTQQRERQTKPQKQETSQRTSQQSQQKQQRATPQKQKQQTTPQASQKRSQQKAQSQQKVTAQQAKSTSQAKQQASTQERQQRQHSTASTSQQKQDTPQQKQKRTQTQHSHSSQDQTKDKQETRSTQSQQEQQPKQKQPQEQVQEQAASQGAMYLDPDEVPEHVYRYMVSQITQAWHPPAGISSDITCHVKVSLTGNGKVSHVAVEQSSGVLAFDMAARAAMWRITSYPQALGGHDVITYATIHKRNQHFLCF